MAHGTENIITKVKFYHCGYCTNNLQRIFRGRKASQVDFYARVMRLEHRVYGSVLVDTGYSSRVYRNGLISKLYTLLNPTAYKKADHLRNQLFKEGVRKEDIHQIILTHLHPDHIGGLRDFKGVDLVMSTGSRQLIEKHRFRDLVFKNMIRGVRRETREAVALKDHAPLEGFKGTDLYGDGSLWLMALDGHAKGQMGVYLPEHNLFYVADALWGMAYKNDRLRWVPRMIQHDYQAYKETVNKLKALKDIRIITTHGDEVTLDG